MRTHAVRKQNTSTDGVQGLVSFTFGK